VQPSSLRPRHAIPVIAVVATFVVACGHSEQEVRTRLAQIDHVRLVAEARTLQTKCNRQSIAAVPRVDRPSTIAAFEPEYAYVDQRGVYVCTHEVFVESAGLFIRTDEAFLPPQTGDPGYEPVGADLYWYYAPG
jgi:hypothetical protein